MDRWRHGFKKTEPKDLVEYVSVGSKEGIDSMIAKKFDIGFSHAPMSEDQLKQAKDKGGEVVQIPVGISAIVPIYNVKELYDQPPLKFTADVLAKIFLGDIKTWDDPELLADNPQLKKLKEEGKLGSTKIVVVHRKDASGTTGVFTEYLQGASKVWRDGGLGKKDQINWKVGEGIERSEQLAKHVDKTEGAIGYVEVLHARLNGIQFGAVQNADKTDFIHVRPDNITAAATRATLDLKGDDLIFDLINKPGKESYPICAAAWAVCYQKQPAEKQKYVVEFLTWVTHEGQEKDVNIWTYDPRFTRVDATATLNKDAVGAVSLVEYRLEKEKKVTITKREGIGYQTPPKVTLVPVKEGEGKGAAAIATVSPRGKVTGFVVTDGGSGYTRSPKVEIDPPSPERLFAPLPKELVTKIEQRLKTIK